MKEKVLFYAMGGGLGHLQRSLTLLNSLGLAKQQVVLWSASRHLAAFARHHQLQFQFVPMVLANQKIHLQEFIKAFLLKEQIGSVWLDVFPVGIVGEWNGLQEQFSHLQWYHITRRMQWKIYEPLVKQAPIFLKTLVAETLEIPHYLFLQKNSLEIIPYTYLPTWQTTPSTLPPTLPPLFYLILHSEPAEEVVALLQYAYDKRQLYREHVGFVVVTQVPFADIHEELPTYLKDVELVYLDTFIPEALIDAATRVFTACGFNTMHLLQPYRHKHHFIPFERKFDDQFWRSLQARKV